MSAKKNGRPGASERDAKKILALVIKADSAGTVEAIISGLDAIESDKVKVEPIHSGVGDISKSDLLMAETGSRLVVGFEVNLLPRIKEMASEKGIEIRLHDVIYKLLADIKEIALAIVPEEEKEKITGRAKVIALFKGGHKGVIIGCEVLDGVLALKKKFRLISDPGTVYVGTIDSLHIEARTVKEASAGEKVGLKIPGFKRAREGDLVEVFETISPKHRQWQPRGGVFDLRSGGK